MDKELFKKLKKIHTELTDILFFEDDDFKMPNKLKEQIANALEPKTEVEEWDTS